VVLGAIIGTGIYLKPAEMAREAGSPTLMMAAWVVAGVLSLLGTLSIAELGAALPEAGGQYEYLRRAFGPAWGFLFGWKTTLIGNPTSQASLASGLMLFVSYLIPSVTRPIAALDLHLPFFGAVPLGMTLDQPLAALVIWGVAIVNLSAVQKVGRLQVLLSGFKVMSLIVIIGLGLVVVGDPVVGNGGSVASVGVPSARGFLAAVAAALWAFSGWHTLTHLGGEVAQPGKTLPRAIITGFLITVGLFIAFNLVTLLALPFNTIANSNHVASDMLERAAGADASVWLTLAMIVSVIGTLNSTTLAAARVPFAMARDGLFFKPLARLSARTRTPRMAVMFQAFLSTLLVLTGTFEDLTSLFIFANWLFFALVIAGLMRLRSTEPDLPRPFRVWPYPLVPVLFIVLSVVLTIGILIQRPLRSGIGLLVLLLGIPVYHWMKKGSLRPSHDS
jgi:amino acid transporter